ncbi:PVC-type heme-binding CxxCH protein [Frigoriglobus tundricola]|uniref:Beta-propeller-type glycoside hydrolase n=1 Tax=Frigoriglobus tundricola TaxID=2774151 RepID=A0A6M5YQL5_9BACT|nr:PVC-type heme-binding CxxCH protein [Frigoriglobus tundricola]QJW95656.1 beta-propeller-type glycoside hydrolase [Frigoriglobus tundricola]
MYRLALVSLLALPPAASAQPVTHQVKLNGHTFTLPQGFTIEVAAGADLAPRPIVAAFDDQGRLYVCDSSGSNARVTEQVKNKPHRILRLESTKGDGRFDKQTVFVKNVMFPEGAMWLNGSLYVGAPPHIWKFTDTDDDGVADKEEVWFDGKTLTGCANDLHGPYRGPDGWIYWCKGAFAKQEYTVNGKKFATRAAHIFRARPDGTGVEPVMTGGMDNPVDVVFTPGGDIIFDTTFFQHPGGGKRDGLVHAVYGAVYGKDHDPVYEHPWTSPTLMPPMTHMGPAAPAGLHRYESDQFGKEYVNNIFCCQFNLRKVSRHVLVPKGSTYETRDSDFVVSDNIDFHPTDVIEDADGSLLIVDTGGWYKLCCPTSQLVKPDVTGAIYRVKKAGAHKVDDPRGLKVDWVKADLADLADRLDDPRPVVRTRATDAILARGEAGIKTLAGIIFVSHWSDSAYVRAVAALTGVNHPLARQAARQCLGPLVQGDLALAGIHAAGTWRDKEAVDDLVSVLRREGLPREKRAAAAALGRIGDAKAVPALLAALAADSNDRTLDHALTYALIEIGDATQTAQGLKSPAPRVRRACLAALENIPDSGLGTRAVFAELDVNDPALRETAWWIAGRHPQWGDQLAGYFKEKFQHLEKLTPAEQDELVSRAVPFLKANAVRATAGDALAAEASASAQRALLRGLAKSGLKAFPAEWKAGVRRALGSRSDEVVRDAILVLRAAPPNAADFHDLSEGAAKDRARQTLPTPKELVYALAAVGPVGTALPPEPAALVIADLHRDQPGAVRSAAADRLARAALANESLVALTAALKTLHPLELPKLIGVFAKSTDEAVGLALVAALRDPAVRPAVRAEAVKPILDKYPQAVKDGAEKLYAELAAARKGETARLEKLLADMKPGDVRRGQLVFNSAKTNCIACHKVGYVGGSAGPDLTRIGGIRTERDLLESVLFPSASFVRSYEPYRVVTNNDRVLNGVLKKDAPDEIVIVVAADKEERVARSDIESIAPSTVSLMPAGMEQQLTAQDLADLIAFLKACK